MIFCHICALRHNNKIKTLAVFHIMFVCLLFAKKMASDKKNKFFCHIDMKKGEEFQNIEIINALLLSQQHKKYVDQPSVCINL
jgi:hypothetical protein